MLTWMSSKLKRTIRWCIDVICDLYKSRLKSTIRLRRFAHIVVELFDVHAKLLCRNVEGEFGVGAEPHLQFVEFLDLEPSNLCIIVVLVKLVVVVLGRQDYGAHEHPSCTQSYLWMQWLLTTKPSSICCSLSM